MEYTVKTGDTIAAVTRQMGVSFSQLKKANPNAFGRSRNGHWFLVDGTSLATQDPARHCASQTASQAPDPKASNFSPQASETTEYTIQTGETIKSVTERFGLSFQSLKESNPEALGRTSDGRRFLYAGARIKVPQNFTDAMAEAASKAAQPLSIPSAPKPPVPGSQTSDSQIPLPAPDLDNEPLAEKVSGLTSPSASPAVGRSLAPHPPASNLNPDSDSFLDQDRPLEQASSSASGCPFVAKNLIGFKFDF